VVPLGPIGPGPFRFFCAYATLIIKQLWPLIRHMVSTITRVHADVTIVAGLEETS
jgi:hypothetical protein